MYMFLVYTKLNEMFTKFENYQVLVRGHLFAWLVSLFFDLIGLFVGNARLTTSPNAQSFNI